jgi:hypothetical protein
MTASGRRIPVVTGAVMILCLVFIITPFAAHALPPRTPEVKVVPTEVCSCAASAPSMAPGAARFQPGIPPGSAYYDEQIGLTFTQNFKSIEYNVTAVEQTDPGIGDGPASLVNGLSSSGYWYQVGVSWDWSPGQNPGTGFDMNYEVFDSAGNSVFPNNGQGGVAAFSGPVNAGNLILLDLYFSNSSQSVVMLAEDTDTGAVASESYSNMGSTYFMGLPGSVANSEGFFTGLMTEWYHGAPYYANEAGVTYSNPNFALSSAWMWMDEFNGNTLQAVFSANTSAPISYGDPTKLQEFSFNGTTEYADAYEFITGSLTNGTGQASQGVPLTLSFSVVGGGSGYSSPTLTYVSNGTLYAVPLTESAAVYYADPGTDWNVSSILGGSTSSERWETGQAVSGVANSSETVQFVYHDQEYVMFGFSVLGGGSGYSPPTVTYVSFGSSATTPLGAGVWADAGSRYQYSNPLSGSTAAERWFAISEGPIGLSHQITTVYYHQYLATFDISFKNTEIFPGLALKSESAGQPYSATVVSGTNKEWLDSGAPYSVAQSYSLESGQRLITNGTASGEVLTSFTVALVYQHQFYIGILQNLAGGGTESPQSGWYDSGSTLQLDAMPASGWQFEGWQGVGSDSASGSNPTLSLTVGPGAPSNETAVFYPGVVIDATGPDSVSYNDGPSSGSLAGGSSTRVYVPPSSVLSLTASNSAPLTTFAGWSGVGNSSGTTASLLVNGPATVTSESGYNFGGIILALGIALVAIAATLALIRKRWSTSVSGHASESTDGQVAPDNPTLPDSLNT